ncbi:MAG: PAS domain S-box protein [bacterium]|nr:PAS domain S-box protein [bacterium]
MSDSTEDLLRHARERIQTLESEIEGLRETGDHFGSVLEQIEDGYYETDLRGRFTFANPAICRILGYSVDEILDIDCRTYYASEQQRQIVEHTYDAIKATGRAVAGLDWTVTGKDGSIRTVEVSASLMRDTEGRPCGFRGIARDVTDRRRAEEALRFQAILLDQIQDRITATDLEGRVTYVNAAQCETLGRTRDEVLNHTTEIYGDDAGRGGTQKEILSETLARGSWRGEVVNRTADDEERIVDNRTWLVRDEHGEPTGLCGIATDITERKRAENALRHNEEEARQFSDLLTRLLETTYTLSRAETVDGLCRQAIALGTSELGFDRLGLWFYDRKNECLIGSFGTDPEGAVRDERSNRMSLTPDALPRELHESPSNYVLHRDVLLADTGPTPVRGDSAAASMSSGDDVIGYLFTDNLLNHQPFPEYRLHVLVLYASALGHLCARQRAVEEHARIESKFQQTQKLEGLGILAGGIAHDFNNLLMGILGHADLALLDLPESASARANLSEVTVAARRAAELCRQLLAYSGRGHFVAEPMDLNAVVREMTNLLDVTTSKKAILKCNLVDGLPAILGDGTQIRQVVMNLITNASDAIGDATGIISIVTGVMACDRDYLDTVCFDENLPEGFYVYIEVSDTGCGMDAETQAMIFDPFYTTKVAGRGLGLAAVLGIVRGHRGALRVYSELGRGTTFKILFPCTEAQSVTETCAPDVETTWRGEGTILVVDDEDTVRALARKMLQRLGFDVLTAVDGQEGMEIFEAKSDRIRLVLLDLTMPRLDGVQAFRAMRRVRGAVPVILSSGYSEQISMDELSEEGLAGFLQKPYQLTTLTETVRAALGE